MKLIPVAQLDSRPPVGLSRFAERFSRGVRVHVPLMLWHRTGYNAVLDELTVGWFVFWLNVRVSTECRGHCIIVFRTGWALR